MKELKLQKLEDLDELEDLDNLDDLNLITDKDIIMKGGAARFPGTGRTLRPRAAAPQIQQQRPDDFNVDDELQTKLLQILDKGIDDIVIQIKSKIGNGKLETNEYAKRIVDLLDGISDEINPKITNLGTPGDNDNILIRKNSDTNKYETLPQDHYQNLNLAPGSPGYNALVRDEQTNATNLLEFYKNSKYNDNGYGSNNKHINMQTLDTPRADTTPPNVIERETNNVEEIENRLNNCQHLELLYLVKHDELMKTFAFTLNLFDKYKYSIKVILFILKNLVYKKGPDGPSGGPEPGGPGTPNIKLPKALIPNIMKLIQDQKQVQEVITSMRETLDENSKKYFTTDPTTGAKVPTSQDPEIQIAASKLNKLSSDESTNQQPVYPSAAKLSEDIQIIDTPPNPSGIIAEV
jgi:hypothetical protein